MPQNNETYHLARIRSEFLSSLGNYPEAIRSNKVTLGDLALDLGKTLTWIAGHFDTGNTTCEPLGKNPQSIAALGKQFQEVGLAMLENESAGVTMQDQRTVQWVSKELNRVAERISRRQKKGGAL